MDRRDLLKSAGAAVGTMTLGAPANAAQPAPLNPATLRTKAAGDASRMMRVAAVQLQIGANVDENLKTCLRMIDQAAQSHPDLIVLPEFCNHWSTVADKKEGYDVALAYDGPFLTAIGKKAAEHRAYIALNVTTRKPQGKIGGTNVLFDPTGALVTSSDKQVLMGRQELNQLDRATELSKVVDSPFGRLGMFSCMDGVLFETPRVVALQGAQLLINTLNSFALDEASLHIPVRAAENKVFIIASNKIGLLLPLEDAERLVQGTGRTTLDLEGAGEAQIVAPDGKILARAPRRGEHVVVADINLSEADNKLRPDGTDIYADRRPELYRPIAVKPGARTYKAGADDLLVGIYQPAQAEPDRLDKMLSAVSAGVKDNVQLISLPELCGTDARDPATAAKAGRDIAERIRAVIGASSTHVATSIVTAEAKGAFAHPGVLIGSGGIVLRQQQLHRCGRHPWATALGTDVATLDLPWGRVALVLGGDTIYPESFRLAALKDVEVVASPTAVLERWEIETGFLERSAENRLSIVMASQKSAAGAGMIMVPGLKPSMAERPFRGNLNCPDVVNAAGAVGLVKAVIHPAAAKTRLVAEQTDVVDSRPWWLLEPLLRRGSA